MPTREQPISDVRVVTTSMVVSIFDACLNLCIALFTGSAVVMSQALQSTSDLMVGGTLYFGVKRSKREADGEYQFGYGRELFFWVLIAGIAMFIGTGSFALYFGYQQFVNAEPVRNVLVAFATVVFGLFTNYFALSQSIKRLHQLDPRTSWWRQLIHSSIIETKATLLVDFMGTAAAAWGLVALFIYLITRNAQFDGLGSIVIGVGMMASAILLIKDVRDLIVGRAVDDKVARRIKRAAESVEGVISVLDLRTMYLGSARILVIIEIHVEDSLKTGNIEKLIDAVKAAVIKNVPLVHHIQVEVETPDVPAKIIPPITKSSSI